jgi:hypothetical protein
MQALLQFSNTFFLLATALFLLAMQSLQLVILHSQLPALGFLLL